MTTADRELESFGYHQELKRSLTLWQLTAFGLNYMIPIAPAIIFGFILVASGGSVALPYLIGGIAMAFTAISYAVLVKRFPIAGSLYSYVSRAMHPHIGFIAGWALLLDYLLIPTVTSMSSVIYIRQFFPRIPYEALLLIFVFITGCINILNVKIMARLGLWLLIIGEVVIFAAFAVWAYAVAAKGLGTGHLLSLEPFQFHNLNALANAASIAVLSYLGFDAITTLSEEANNPKRDIPRAIFFSVLIGGFTMFLTGYIGMLVIPHWHQLSHHEMWLNTTLFYISEITGGKGFAAFYTAGFVLAMGVFNTVAVAAGSRLLFGMGRDAVLPKKIFGALQPRWKTPHYNILLIVLLEFALGSLLSVDSVTSLINYGALFGFILLNASVIYFYFTKIKQVYLTSILIYLISPLLGITVLSWIFIHLKHITLIIGTTWLIIGITIGMIQSKFYRKNPPMAGFR